MMKAVLLFPALALLALGCATSAAPETDGMAEALPTRISATPSAPSGEGAEAKVEPAQVGTGVGDHIPGFAINLADGSTVTLDELRQDRQPTFLFFFETW
jgi:hypothetical protein